MADSNVVRAPETTFVTDPINPVAGQPFTVTWHEVNIGTEASAPYTDTIQMNDSSGNVEATLDNDSLDPGDGVVERTVSMTLETGNYNMNLYIADSAGEYLGNLIVNDS